MAEACWVRQVSKAMDLTPEGEVSAATGSPTWPVVTWLLSRFAVVCFLCSSIPFLTNVSLAHGSYRILLRCNEVK